MKVLARQRSLGSSFQAVCGNRQYKSLKTRDGSSRENEAHVFWGILGSDLT